MSFAMSVERNHTTKQTSQSSLAKMPASKWFVILSLVVIFAISACGGGSGGGRGSSESPEPPAEKTCTEDPQQVKCKKDQPPAEKTCTEDPKQDKCPVLPNNPRKLFEDLGKDGADPVALKYGGFDYFSYIPVVKVLDKTVIKVEYGTLKSGVFSPLARDQVKDNILNVSLQNSDGSEAETENFYNHIDNKAFPYFLPSEDFISVISLTDSDKFSYVWIDGRKKKIEIAQEILSSKIFRFKGIAGVRFRFETLDNKLGNLPTAEESTSEILEDKSHKGTFDLTLKEVSGSPLMSVKITLDNIVPAEPVPRKEGGSEFFNIAYKPFAIKKFDFSDLIFKSPTHNAYNPTDNGSAVNPEWHLDDITNFGYQSIDGKPQIAIQFQAWIFIDLRTNKPFPVSHDFPGLFAYFNLVSNEHCTSATDASTCTTTQPVVTE